MFRFIFIFPLVLLLSGCGYYNITKQKPAKGPRDLSKATLSFATVKAVVLQDYCITCHSEAKATANKPALETFPQVFALRNDVRASVASGSMPDDGPLPPMETELLYAWLDADAPEVSDLPIPGKPQPPAPQPVPEPVPVPVPDPEPTPDPVEKVTFEEIKARLLQPLCIECHASFGTYEKVVRRIVEIQSSIENNEMPKDASPVSDELKALLKQWIDQGLPQN